MLQSQAVTPADLVACGVVGFDCTDRARAPSPSVPVVLIDTLTLCPSLTALARAAFNTFDHDHQLPRATATCR